MTESENVANAAATVQEVQQGWRDFGLKILQLEAEVGALKQENKALRSLLERVVEHRQKSHTELVLLLTNLVSKLPINDIGVVVSKLVEHNTNVSQYLAATIKGTAHAEVFESTVLKTFEQTKRDLAAALKPLVEELIQLDTPLEREILQSLITRPESFFSPHVLRATRCFIKGQVPRERIVREYGQEALVFFTDLTTDAKLNPRPKPEEIVLGFKADFEALFGQHPSLIPSKRQELHALYQRVQRSKGLTEQARAQKSAFQKLSFIIELLHYYEHQNTESPDVLYAQRLPALIEQLVIAGPQDNLDERLIVQAEHLLAFVISPDHRQMIVNNIGKGGGVAKTVKYVLRLRAEKVPDQDHVIPEFIKHLVPEPKAPTPERLTAILRLIHPDMQRSVLKYLMNSDRLRKEEAEALGKAVGAALGLKGIDEQVNAQQSVPPEVERQIAWAKIKELITRRTEAAAVAAAIRERLHAKYDADEIRQSWITLTEAEPISLIKIVCHIPYLANGKTDTIARTIMETYVTRLTHDKYVATYKRVVNSLRSMFTAKPDSPTLLNFMALVRWVDPEAANKLCADIGMPAPTH